MTPESIRRFRKNRRLAVTGVSRDGSVSPEAVQQCEDMGIDCIVGGCPMMFCEPVDIVHRFMRWWLQRKGRVPKD